MEGVFVAEGSVVAFEEAAFGAVPLVLECHVVRLVALPLGERARLV